jgi:hypothetical protein
MMAVWRKNSWSWVMDAIASLHTFDVIHCQEPSFPGRPGDGRAGRAMG